MGKKTHFYGLVGKDVINWGVPSGIPLFFDYNKNVRKMSLLTKNIIGKMT